MKAIKTLLIVLMLVMSLFAVSAQEVPTGEASTDANAETSAETNLEQTTEVNSETATDTVTDTASETNTETATTSESETSTEVDAETETEAGITPDQPVLWGIERALENIDEALTLNKAAKAKKGLAHARERLIEVRAMILEKRIEAAAKAEEKHKQKLHFKFS